jgi:aldose 1-epimerase
MPWPNRIEDGKWTLNGEPMQLDITEPARNNSLHGLLRHAPYSVVDQTETAITLAATVFPQGGYPFLLDTTVRYELTDDGLVVTHGVHNLSAAKAPVAVGTHPFFTISDVPSEDLVLTVNAARWMPGSTPSTRYRSTAPSMTFAAGGRSKTSRSTMHSAK